MKVRLLALVCVSLAQSGTTTSSSLSVANKNSSPTTAQPWFMQAMNDIVTKVKHCWWYNTDLATDDQTTLPYKGEYTNYKECNGEIRIYAPGGYKAENNASAPGTNGKRVLEVRNNVPKGVYVKIKSGGEIWDQDYQDILAEYIVIDRNNGNKIRIRCVAYDGGEKIYEW
uniref:Uncharacterized protein n=1 Tax=Cacopsylla melanoneura TaxID=428564 RepID=A0A8D8UES7_9HEMI